MPNADLSIIVPTLNEASNIALLLKDLQRQKNIHLEVIIVDGGSCDNTLAVIDQFPAQNTLSIKTITSPAGRGLQMNRGAQNAAANQLLFLHADSRIDDSALLETAWRFFTEQLGRVAQERLAGHFALRFERSQNTAPLAYYFYECKTHLNRLDTINGDQGFMLTKRFFQTLDGFDESLGYMEDARLARKIFAAGQWITLPGTLTTSARRFEAEGLKQRQILNAFLCNFEHIGLPAFFTAAASAYRAQDKTRRLDLKPFLQLIHKLARDAGLSQATRLWFQTGAYVASNAWQLALAWDCRRNFAKGFAPGLGSTPTIRFYDARVAPIINSPPGKFIVTVAVFIWFYSLFWISGLRR